MLPRKDSPFEAQAGSGQYALEDMISSLQTRGAQLDDEEDELSQDPSQLLAQRDRDLVLAAELGKALLERNQELTRQSEALAENYASKIEVSYPIADPWHLLLLYAMPLIVIVLAVVTPGSAHSSPLRPALESL
ncbi:hypothetical protein TKK_0016907 [Trichogramma kaykai]